MNWLHQLVPDPLQLSIGGPVPEVGYNAYDGGVPAEQWREDGTGAPGGGSVGGARARPNVVVGPWRMTAFQRLDFTADDVARCVEGSDGIIGAGSSGTVYRAKMPNGEVIAVKKLWRQPSAHKEGGGGAPAAEPPPKRRKEPSADADGNGNGNRSMLAEVEVLGHLRHRNIVRLLGWCTDGVATLLLYEYMPNGSLDDLLHGAAGAGAAGKAGLDWDARHRIAVGVAQGVSYLHHDCVPAVAHCDLKPSKILLDTDMEARVANFGVAKALHGAAPMSVVAVVLPWQLPLLFTSFALMSLGSGGIRPCTLASEEDQLGERDNSAKNVRTLQTFFNWYYTVLGLSIVRGE